MKQRNFRLLFMLYFIIFGFALTMTGGFISYKYHHTNIESTIEKYARAVLLTQKNTLFKPAMEKVETTLRALAFNDTMRHYLKTPTPALKQRLETLFLTVTDADSTLIQARYIDANGMERIRINRDSETGATHIVRPEELQDKSHRYYFLQLKSMKTPQIWHSPIDLNIENGTIKEPYRPTMRIATPLFQNGRFEGMVIINMLTTKLFESINHTPMFNHYIVDKTGHYLLHPDSHYSWNRYTGKQRLLSDDFPEEADAILSKKMQGKNFFAADLDDIFQNDDDARLILQPKDELMGTLQSTNLESSIAVALLSILLSLPIAYIASRKPSELQKKLYMANLNLARFAKILDRYVISATTTPQGVITDVSRAFCKASGYEHDDLIGKNMNIIRHHDTPKETFKTLWRTILALKEWHGEIKNRGANGNDYWLDQSIIPVIDEAGTLTSFMSIGIDISSKKKLERISQTDGLTRIYNRRKLDASLELELEKTRRFGKPLSLILIDIDHFKNINDTYGHPCGDQVLRELTGLIGGHIRKIDYFGRFGGEEFLILCTQTDFKGAWQLAEHLRASVETHTFKSVSHLTISLGVTSYEENDDAMTLIQRCDKGLYRAKTAGRNRVCS